MRLVSDGLRVRDMSVTGETKPERTEESTLIEKKPEPDYGGLNGDR